MIKNSKSLSMSEAAGYIGKKENDIINISSFIKKFIKLKSKDAQELRKKLKELDLMKMKTEHVVKIIDLMPANQEELNKIFANISLNEDETKKILETIKEFK